jgi:hypothetical protein
MKEGGGMKMKKIFLVGAMFLVLWMNFLLGQEVKKSYSYTFDKGVGECVFTGVSLDQVWSATIKMLMLDKFGPISAEKPSGIINAENHFGTKYSLLLFFEQVGSDVRVISSMPDTNPGSEEKHEKKFYDKMAELLYGKIEK